MTPSLLAAVLFVLSSVSWTWTERYIAVVSPERTEAVRTFAQALYQAEPHNIPPQTYTAVERFNSGGIRTEVINGKPELLIGSSYTLTIIGGSGRGNMRDSVFYVIRKENDRIVFWQVSRSDDTFVLSTFPQFTISSSAGQIETYAPSFAAEFFPDGFMSSWRRVQ